VVGGALLVVVGLLVLVVRVLVVLVERVLRLVRVQVWVVWVMLVVLMLAIRCKRGVCSIGRMVLSMLAAERADRWSARPGGLPVRRLPHGHGCLLRVLLKVEPLLHTAHACWRVLQQAQLRSGQWVRDHACAYIAGKPARRVLM
jgi:hypothetical protein